MAYIEDLRRRIIAAVRAGEDAASTALTEERTVVRGALCVSVCLCVCVSACAHVCV